MRTKLLVTVTCFLGIILFLFSCTSSNKVIKQTQGFFVTLSPGIVAVDENGKEMPSNSQANYSVYAVTSSDKVKWDSAWINDRIYTISVEKINASPVVEVGIDKATGSKVTITIGETDHLYLLHLNPVLSSPKMHADPLGELKIKATYKGKVINCTITNIKELSTPDPA
jgi:hypothetical protein